MLNWIPSVGFDHGFTIEPRREEAHSDFLVVRVGKPVAQTSLRQCLGAGAKFPEELQLAPVGHGPPQGELLLLDLGGRIGGP